MEYKTLIPSYDIEKKQEYNKPYTTADTLTEYSLYKRTEKGNLKLFAIGGSIKDGFCDNWDIYADNKGHLYSIARKSSGCEGTHYGDINHIKSLMRKGQFYDTLTAYGFQMMKGEIIA